MATKAVAKKEEQSIMAAYTREQLNLIKNTVARECTDDELQLFLYRANKAGLDPLAKQIHAIKRWDSKLGKKIMTIQTGIDGFRVIANRTHKYAPGKETVFRYDPIKEGKIISATTYVKKYVQGEWHESPQIAFWDEYCPKEDFFWQKMKHGQIEKCSEAKNLRKCFPEDLSGLYINEEMQQADREEPKSIKMGEGSEPDLQEKKPQSKEKGGYAESKGETKDKAPLSPSPSGEPRKIETEVMFEGVKVQTAGIAESFKTLVWFQRNYKKVGVPALIKYLADKGMERISELTENEAQEFLFNHADIEAAEAGETEPQNVKSKVVVEEPQPTEEPPLETDKLFETGPEKDDTEEHQKLMDAARSFHRNKLFGKIRSAGFEDVQEKIIYMIKSMFGFASLKDCKPEKIELAIEYLDTFFVDDKRKDVLRVTLDSLKVPE